MLHHYIARIKTIFLSIPFLSKNNSTPAHHTETLTLLKGFALLAIAFIFAWIANQHSSALSKKITLETEWPAMVIWESLMQQKGCQPVQVADLSSVLKKHPNPFPKSPEIWITPDHTKVLLLHSPYSATPEAPELWNCAAPKTRQSNESWKKLSAGYQGLNELAHILPKYHKKQASFVDPKEIRY